MSVAVAEITTPSSDVVMTPMHMLERALASGASIEILERLMVLQERHSAAQAKREFDAAFAAAKAEIKPIVRNQAIMHGDKFIANYADMAAVTDGVDPILAKNNLSYSFEPDVALDGQIVVTCVLSHPSGHEKRYRLPAPKDTTGAKNAIQAIGSSLTYLSRYTLCLAMGIAMKDDDGRAAGVGQLISNDDAKHLIEKMNACGLGQVRFCRAMKIASVSELPLARYDEADRRIMNFKDQKEASNAS
jgi:ERF superfamily